MNELKPCPFCGGDAELRETSSHDYFIRCTNKQCASRTRNYHENKNGAISAWNTRYETGEEIVRCCDCNHCIDDWNGNEYVCMPIDDGEIFGVNPIGFCAWGVRRND